MSSSPDPMPDPLRPLRLATRASWLFGSLAAGLLWGEFLAGVLHPWGWTFAGLALASIAATLACGTLGLWRVARGPRRLRSLGLMVIGLVPAVLVVAVIAAGAAQYRRGQIARTLPFIAFAMAGTSLGEIEAPWHFPHRLESDRLIMFYDARVTDPEGDLVAMERYVANLERIMHRPLRAKIEWVRGSLLGQRSLSIGGFALGSDASPALALDRHELAHAVLYQAMSPGTSPPMLLAEGWAESRSVDPVVLAERALRERDMIEGLAREVPSDRRKSLEGWHDAEAYEWMAARAADLGPGKIRFLHELGGPWWYHRDKGSVYNIGGAFVDHLVRTHGAERFVAFYLLARPGRFDESFCETYGQTLDECEAEFWSDCERLTHRSGSVR